MAEYAELLDELYLEELRVSVGRLGKLNIEPWGRGTEFYWTGSGKDRDINGANVVGVLIMAMLLTLGAPFWFQALRNLAGLRDLLAPVTGKRKPGDATSGAPGDSATDGQGGS